MGLLRFSLVVSVLTFVQLSQAQNDDVVLRASFGVVFKKKSIINVAESTWFQTFQIPIPQLDKLVAPISFGNCTHYSVMCKRITNAARYLTQRRSKMINRIQKWVDEVQDLIPAQWDGERSKRAILEGIGKVAGSIFGWVSTSDFEKFKNHVNLLTKQVNLNTAEIQSFEKEMHSVMKITSERLANAMQGVAENHRNIEVLVANMNLMAKQVDNLEAAVVALGSLISESVVTMGYLADVETQLYNWVLASRTLVEGYLPLAFVPRESLQQVLTAVDQGLAKEYPRFRVVHKNPLYYYNIKKNILFSRTRDSILISLKIPLEEAESRVQLYSVISVPVPLNHSSLETSKIVNLPRYLGVTLDGQFVNEWYDEYTSSCEQQGDQTVCNMAVALRSKTLPSCASAIYFSNLPDALKYCDIRFQKEGGILNGAIQLAPGPGCSNPLLSLTVVW